MTWIEKVEIMLKNIKSFKDSEEALEVYNQTMYLLKCISASLNAWHQWLGKTSVWLSAEKADLVRIRDVLKQMILTWLEFDLEISKKYAPPSATPTEEKDIKRLAYV